jgi:hypothetical protein
LPRPRRDGTYSSDASRQTKRKEMGQIIATNKKIYPFTLSTIKHNVSDLLTARLRA